MNKKIVILNIFKLLTLFFLGMFFAYLTNEVWKLVLGMFLVTFLDLICEKLGKESNQRYIDQLLKIYDYTYSVEKELNNFKY